MGNPVKPGKKSKFTVGDVGVRIIDIRDKDNTEYHNKKSEICLKTLDYINKSLFINYEVLGIGQKVNLWIEYKSSKIHDDFYKQYQKGDFQPPRVAWLIRNEKMEPGKYYITWDGRDNTGDLRFILAGEYEVKIEGSTTSWKKTEKTEIKIARPLANLYGIHYWKQTKSGKNWHTSKKEVDHGAKKLKSLKDGTGYEPTAYLDQSAAEATEGMKSSAIASFGGHSNPYTLFLHGKEGEKFKKDDQSRINVFGKKGAKPAYPHTALSMEREGIFKDMFLIILNGCRTGDELRIVQNILKKFNPGKIDGDHGPKTIKALTAFQTINNITPDDGTKNVFTLQWFKLDENLGEKKLTRIIQKKLKGYSVKKLNSILDKTTKRALTNYQTDHPQLQVTGEPDKATLDALKIGKKIGGGYGYLSYLPKNISDVMNHKGADVAIGFVHKVDFSLAEEWQIKFWDNVASGESIRKAADKAVASLTRSKRKQFTFNVYTEKGASPELTIHPARYGKTTFLDNLSAVDNDD